MTLLPGSPGRYLGWDSTCPDNTAASHSNRAVVSASVVARDAKEKKRSKFKSVSSMYEFVAIAVETFGATGKAALNFMKDVDRRISAVTLEQRSFGYLMQRFSVAIQLGNAVCVTGTVPLTTNPDQLFLLLTTAARSTCCRMKAVLHVDNFISWLSK